MVGSPSPLPKPASGAGSSSSSPAKPASASLATTTTTTTPTKATADDFPSCSPKLSLWASNDTSVTAALSSTSSSLSSVSSSSRSSSFTRQPHLWYIHDVPYDLQPFLATHPGGVEALLAAQGTECTEVFVKNHPFTNPNEVLCRYRVGHVDGEEDEEEAEDLLETLQAIREEEKLWLAHDKEEEKGRRGGRDTIDPNLLWFLHGKAYDLRPLLCVHPGGQDLLLNHRGRDCTALFESYHPFTDKPRQLLARFKPVRLPPRVLAAKCSRPEEEGFFIHPLATQSVYKQRDRLWEALRHRCRDYFIYHDIDPKVMGWPFFLLHATALLTALFIYVYGYLHFNAYISWGASVLLALFVWVGGRFAHDGLHHALSHRPWVNAVCGTIGAIGLYNVPYWEVSHNMKHHAKKERPPPAPGASFSPATSSSSSTTSSSSSSRSLEEGGLQYSPEDDDSDSQINCRLSLHRVGRYLKWSLTTLGLLFFKPLLMLLCGCCSSSSSSSSHRSSSSHPTRPLFWLMLFLHFATFWVLFLGLPVYISLIHVHTYASLDGPSLTVVIAHRLLSLALYLGLTGLLYGCLTQVSHLAEGCEQATTPQGGKQHPPVQSWAQRQIERTANFAAASFWWSVFSQGFNVQIEHHLFPSVPSDKLVLLIPIVKATCKEFGVQYEEYPSFLSILRSTHRAMDTRVLKQVAQEKRRVARVGEENV